MAYTTVGSLKSYLGIPAVSTADDGLLAGFVAAAEQAINDEMGRRFEATTQTRYYGPGAVQGQLLQLDEDLLLVTTVTNGDGAALAASEFVLWPRNTLPAWAIRLKSTSAWQFATADAEIAVAGQWGYSASPPASVTAAAERLAAYLYRLKDQQNFEVTRSERFGSISVPVGMIRELNDLLRSVRKRSF